MVENSQIVQKRIRVRIPKNYHREPIISSLVSQYNLTVNINAAMLGGNANGDGWFDLELQGTNEQIQNALSYLNDLDLEFWNDTQTNIW